MGSFLHSSPAEDRHMYVLIHGSDVVYFSDITGDLRCKRLFGSEQYWNFSHIAAILTIMLRHCGMLWLTLKWDTTETVSVQGTAVIETAPTPSN